MEPTDFLDYFQRNGSAAQFDYDLSTFTQTLTPNQTSQSGNVTLKNKIDMSSSFQFKGLVNLGDKSKAQGGADGIGFEFQPGNTDVVGHSGGAAGIGGVPGAFGFKLDTYYNGDNKPGWYEPDPSQFSDGQSFGAFVDGTSGVAITDATTAQSIPQPSNNAFVPIQINYDGNTKTMTINYNGQTWSKDLSTLVGENKAMSFAISASTGNLINLQQLRNVEFTYTVAQGRVNANYVDTQGNNISESISSSGDLGTNYTTTKKDIPGYTFKEVTGDPSEGQYTANDQTVTYVYTRDQGAADVKYIDDTTGKVLETKDLSGNTGDKAGYSTSATIKAYEDMGYQLVSDSYPINDVTFTGDTQHYEVHLNHRIDKANDTKTIGEIVHYVYKDGSKALDDYVAKPVEFTRTVSTDAVTGEKTYSVWSKDQSFDAVTSPELKGYTPNKSQIDKQTVTGDSTDLEFTIIYTKDSTTPVPVDPTNPDIPKNPTNPAAPKNPTNPTVPTPQSPTVTVTLNKTGQTPVINKETLSNLPHTGTQQNVANSLTVSALILGLITSLSLFLKRKFK